MNWPAVTVLEFAAIDLLRRDDAPAALNEYARRSRAEAIIASGEPRDDVTGFFTPRGAEWYAELRARYSLTDDAATLDAARELLRGLGTLAVMGAHRGMIAASTGVGR